jgi:hypothetical protein
MRRASCLLSLLVWIWLAACAKPEVITRYEPDVDFSALHTFGWMEVEEMESPPGLALDPLVDKRIRLSIEKSLYGQGFEQLKDGTPDFFIMYQGGLEEKTEPVPTYRGQGIVTGMQNVRYEEGTLVLDVYDAESKRLLWRGWAIKAFQNRDNAVAYIPKIVQELVRQFPPTN